MFKDSDMPQHQQDCLIIISFIYSSSGWGGGDSTIWFIVRLYTSTGTWNWNKSIYWSLLESLNQNLASTSPSTYLLEWADLYFEVLQTLLLLWELNQVESTHTYYQDVDEQVHEESCCLLAMAAAAIFLSDIRFHCLAAKLQGVLTNVDTKSELLLVR